MPWWSGASTASARWLRAVLGSAIKKCARDINGVSVIFAAQWVFGGQLVEEDPVESDKLVLSSGDHCATNVIDRLVAITCNSLQTEAELQTPIPNSNVRLRASDLSGDGICRRTHTCPSVPAPYQ